MDLDKSGKVGPAHHIPDPTTTFGSTRHCRLSVPADGVDSNCRLVKIN